MTGAGVLGDSCRELADLIEHTRAAVRGAAAEAVADMEPLELPARLLGKLAWNVPELELLVGMGALAVAYLDHYRDAYLFSLDRLVERLSLADEQRLRRAAAPDPPIAAALADVGRVAGLGLTGTAWDTAAGRTPRPTPSTSPRSELRTSCTATTPAAATRPAPDAPGRASSRGDGATSGS